MSHIPSDRIARVIFPSVVIAMAGCNSGDAPTGPIVSQSPSTPSTPSTPNTPSAPTAPSTPPAVPAMPPGSSGMIAWSPTQQVGLANSAAFFLPSVTVFDSLGGYVIGATITCTATRGGVTAVATATTSLTMPLGEVGTCPRWTLGPSSGDDTLVVSVPGLKSLTFVATSHDSSYFEIYQLKKYGEYPVPHAYPGGAVINGGSYFIAPDGTFRNEEFWTGSSIISSGTFENEGAELHLVYRSYGFTWGWGTLVRSGESMTFLSLDPTVETELYTRVR